ncbi:MAG: helix-turn-helix domain-containing protein [Planctomycetes bacterium]|nr:helix-turn-helix domain-containing protein [Planctomycetota bacterium]
MTKNLGAERPAGHVTILEAARTAGVTVGTIRWWVRKGRLPAAAVLETEQTIWIKKADLSKAIKGRKMTHRPHWRDLSALSPNEAGEVLNVTGEAVKQWIYQGLLKATKLPNGYWRIKHDDLKAFLETRQNLSVALYIAGSEPTVSRISSIAPDFGCKVTAFGSHGAALMAMEDIPAKALIVDTGTFGDGLGLIRKIRKTTRYGSPRILLLSPAPPSERETEAMVRLGVGGCLVSPITDAVLRAEVKALVANAGR